MKKTAIVLSLILSAFIISSCAENNPNNPNDPNTDNSTKITLAQRVGNYEGDMQGTKLTIAFDDQGQVTKIMVGDLDFNTIGILPAKVGDPTSTDTEYTFDVQMIGGSTTKVKVVFDSPSQATGGNAYIGIGTEPDMNNPIKITKVS